MKLKIKLLSVLSIVIALNLVGCSNQSNNVSEQKVSNQTYEEMMEISKGSTVNFYGYGGNEVMNKWFDNYIIPKMKENYNIKVKRVGMNIDEIINSLISDKQTNNLNGNMDVIWINGENFKNAKESNLLLGEFTTKLPNYNDYIDKNAEDIKSDFGTSVDNMEAPWGKSQFAIIVNNDKVDKDIKNTEDLKEVIMKNPGKFTYPALPDFTASAFVRNVIYDIVGYENIKNIDADEKKVKEAIRPAMNYLNEIKPYLWNKGNTYPSTTAQLDNMYSDEEVYFTMTYSPNIVPARIESKEFAKETDIIRFESGNISNTHFLTVPFNSKNQEGAMVLINYLMSIDAQASKTFSENWGDSTVLDMNKVEDGEKIKFNNESILIENTVPELRAELIPIIEKIWTQEVLESE